VSHNESLMRRACVVCGASTLTRICETPPVPVYQGCVDSDPGDDLSAAMAWDVCEDCGSAQLANPLPLDLVYQGGHATGLGAAWDRHHEAFAAFVARHRRGDVLEVGGGAGKLARFHHAREHAPHWTILEPNPTTDGEPIANVSWRRGFFDAAFEMPESAHTLVFCHCLEHVYELGALVEVIAAKLPRGARVVIAWPDLESWLARGEPGAINWEHTYFLTVDALTALFRRNGFRLAERETFGTEHSIFLAFEAMRVREEDGLVGGDAAAASALVREYFAKFGRRAQALNRRARESERPVYASPASIYTQYLFAFGLDPRLLRGLIDNSPLKQGRRLYGVPLTIHAAEALRAEASVVFLNGGAHAAEMASGFLRVNRATTVVRVDEIG